MILVLLTGDHERVLTSPVLSQIESLSGVPLVLPLLSICPSKYPHGELQTLLTVFNSEGLEGFSVFEGVVEGVHVGIIQIWRRRIKSTCRVLGVRVGLTHKSII